MKKLLVLALLLGGAHLVYRHFHRVVPIGEYERFADAWARGDIEEALRHADGDQIHRTLKTKSLRALMDARMMEAFHGTRYAVQSTDSTPEGDLVLDVKQTIAFDPPGATTAVGGAMFASFRHVARLRKTTGGWKVVSFEPTFLEIGETRRH